MVRYYPNGSNRKRSDREDQWQRDINSQFDIGLNDAVEFGFNHGYGRLLAGEDLDLDDPYSLLKWSETPFFGRFFKNRYDRMYYDQLQQFKKDRAANLGIDPSSDPYPLLSIGNSGVGQSIGQGLVNSISDFYSDMEHLKRWFK